MFLKLYQFLGEEKLEKTSEMEAVQKKKKLDERKKKRTRKKKNDQRKLKKNIFLGL